MPKTNDERVTVMPRPPIEIGAIVADLRRLIADLPDDDKLRGSVVVWRDEEPVRVIGLAPEYEEEIDR